jgi:hypothetical protein
MERRYLRKNLIVYLSGTRPKHAMDVVGNAACDYIAQWACQFD